MKSLLFIVVFCFTQLITYSQSSLLAFPCAKGAGAYATGGRGGQVIHVTTLNWSGPGSLKEAITTPGKRTIVFDVSGEIDATSEVQWSVLIQGSQYDSLTIAGQTAPAGGITLRTSWLQFWDVDNIIIRYIRIRNSQTYASGDAAWFFGCSDVIIDHCTFSHGGDECFDMATSQGITRNVTIQNSFMQDSKTGVILGTDTRNEPVPLVDTGDFTFINNIFSNISHRFPNTQGNGQYDIINNVVYNWKNRLVRVTQEGTYNVVNNYYKPSQNGLRLPSWFGNGSITFLQKLQAQPYHNPIIYTAGNIVTGQRDTPLTDDSDMWTYFAGSDPSFPEGNPVGSQFFTSTQFPLAGEPFTIKTAHQAYTDVLNNAGANATLNADGSINYYRDTKDAADILMIQNDTYSGSFYEARSTIPYPTVPTNTRTGSFYVSNAHIPEVWFLANVPSGQDHNDIAPTGYTWLEEYLNQVDTCGNGTISNPCSSKNAPIASLASPLTGTYNKADTIDFAVNYTSDTTITSVSYYLNGSLISTNNSPFVFDTIGLSQGLYQVYAVLQDACGNTSNSDTSTITIIPLQVNVCKTTTPPVIDGIEDAVWSNIDYEKMGVTEIGFPYPDTNTLKASYKMMWDATGLYFFIKVKDDTLVSDSPQLDFFRDDAASIYIDLTDNNSTTYDADDYFFGFRRGSNDININFALYTGLDVIKADVITTEGYNMEVKINWAYFGAFVPDTANPIGLDFRIDDDDNGGSREHHLLWNDETSTLWSDPSKFGVLKLKESVCYNTTVITEIIKGNILVYPNPTNDYLKVVSTNVINKIEIYNSLGALVLLKNKLNNKSEDLNITNLPKGVYIMKIYELNNVEEKQIIKQ